MSASGLLVTDQAEPTDTVGARLYQSLALITNIPFKFDRTAADSPGFWGSHMPQRKIVFTPVVIVTEYDDGSYRVDVSWRGSLLGEALAGDRYGVTATAQRAADWLYAHLAAFEERTNDGG